MDEFNSNDSNPESNPTEPVREIKDEKRKNIGMAVIAYILFFIPLLTKSGKDPFVKYHVKQGLVLFLANVVAMVLVRLPLFGHFLSFPLNIILLILFIFGIVNAVNSEEKPLPLIGQLADNFKF